MEYIGDYLTGSSKGWPKPSSYIVEHWISNCYCVMRANIFIHSLILRSKVFHTYLLVTFFSYWIIQIFSTFYVMILFISLLFLNKSNSFNLLTASTVTNKSPTSCRDATLKRIGLSWIESIPPQHWIQGLYPPLHKSWNIKQSLCLPFHKSRVHTVYPRPCIKESLPHATPSRKKCYHRNQ